MHSAARGGGKAADFAGKKDGFVHFQKIFIKRHDFFAKGIKKRFTKKINTNIIY